MKRRNPLSTEVLKHLSGFSSHTHFLWSNLRQTWQEKETFFSKKENDGDRKKPKENIYLFIPNLIGFVSYPV
jgi:hypothetical protein